MGTALKCTRVAFVIVLLHLAEIYETTLRLDGIRVVRCGVLQYTNTRVQRIATTGSVALPPMLG